MICITPTVGGYWLKIRGVPPVFFGTRAGAMAFVVSGWDWFPIQLPSEE